jgi:hypothetical protein
MKYLRPLAYLFIGTIIVLSCTRNKESKTNSSILLQDSLKIILYELYLADEIINIRHEQDSNLNIQEETIAYSRKVFENHKTNHDQFIKSLNNYIDDPKLLATLTDSLNRYAIKMSTLGLQKYINKTIYGNHFKDSARSSGR